MASAENFIAKMTVIRRRLNSIKHLQKEHFRQFRRIKKWNTKLKAFINVLNTISVTSLVMTFSGSDTTLIVCAVSNTMSAIGTAILSVVNMDSKVHSHQTSYLQFVDLHDTYIAALLQDNLNGKDLDRILIDLNTKVGLILDNCEPIELTDSGSPIHQNRRKTSNETEYDVQHAPNYPAPIFPQIDIPVIIPQPMTYSYHENEPVVRVNLPADDSSILMDIITERH
jgi:hypothetical protein